MEKLRELQLTELSVLEEIDRICNENNIDYAIACGSMLGAIRHKGFIPWDDDLDTYMSYKEFRRFEKVFKSDTCFLQTENTDPNMPFIMYKVRKNNTKVPEKGLEKLDIHQGVWVDIFVYFNAGKTKVAKKLQYYFYVLLRIVRCRSLNKATNSENMFQKILNFLPDSFAKQTDRFIISIIRGLGSKKSNEYVMSVNNVYERLFYPKSVVDGQSLYEFEGKQFKGLKAWNEYLTYEYGKDYMTPKRYDSHLESFDDIELNS